MILCRIYCKQKCPFFRTSHHGNLHHLLQNPQGGLPPVRVDPHRIQEDYTEIATVEKQQLQLHRLGIFGMAPWDSPSQKIGGNGLHGREDGGVHTGIIYEGTTLVVSTTTTMEETTRQGQGDAEDPSGMNDEESTLLGGAAAAIIVDDDDGISKQSPRYIGEGP